MIIKILEAYLLNIFLFHHYIFFQIKVGVYQYNESRMILLNYHYQFNKIINKHILTYTVF